MAEPGLTVFLTGATGYMGRRLAVELMRRGHPVTALVRHGSEAKAPAGCAVVVGNALESASYRDRVPPESTFVHLVGVAHPSPAKAAEFRAIDLASIHGLVTLQQMATALACAIDHPDDGVRVVEVPEIRMPS